MSTLANRIERYIKDMMAATERNSLELKRKEIQRLIDAGLFPYTKRYLGTLPWRGKSQYVVDSVISVRQAAPKMEDDLLEMPLPVEN